MLQARRLEIVTLCASVEFIDVGVWKWPALDKLLDAALSFPTKTLHYGMVHLHFHKLARHVHIDDVTMKHEIKTCTGLN